MTDKNNKLITREDVDKVAPDLSVEVRDQIYAAIVAARTGKIATNEWSFECSMCGKPMSYRYCGMCTHCETVWNS